MKLVLLGYMASGKSVIAKYLASKTTLNQIDLDAYIEQKENLLIADIFKKHGEIKFRLLENKYLLELLESKKSFILSIGGGTPCYANNMDLILRYAISIYLKASVDTLYHRLILNKAQRPLISNIKNKNLQEFIAKHLFERTVFYNQANRILNVNNKSVNGIVEELMGLI